MPKRRRKSKPLGPAWLADMTIAFKGWQVALPLAALAWCWAHWRGVGATVLAVFVWAWTGEPALAVGPLVVWLALKWRPAKRKGWWEHDTLSTALVDAGALRMEGEALPTLSYRGKPQHSEHGTTVTVGLPRAKGLDDVAPRKLAAALRVPVSRLAITQDEEDPANVVRIHVGHTSGRKDTTAPVADAARTEWASPVRVGFDPRGVAVELATTEANTLVAGRPGSGKTSLSRIILGHYLLDPSTAVYLLDGKGSVDDYGQARAMCERFVSGTDDGAVKDTIAMLDEVLEIVRKRNNVGGDHPGVLLLLEEFQDIRAAAGRSWRDDLDQTLGRIVRMGRAVSVHVLVSTQRPTTDDLPAGTRNLLSQRVALMLRNADDHKLVLGTTPALALPKRRGMALFTDGGPVVGVELDRLTDEAWRKLCKRAAALRRPTLSLAPPPVPGEGLVGEVSALLASEGQLSATELHDRLSPEGLSVRDVGVELGRHPHLFTRGYDARGRVWRLAETNSLSARGVEA